MVFLVCPTKLQLPHLPSAKMNRVAETRTMAPLPARHKDRRFISRRPSGCSAGTRHCAQPAKIHSLSVHSGATEQPGQADGQLQPTVGPLAHSPGPAQPMASGRPPSFWAPWSPQGSIVGPPRTTAFPAGKHSVHVGVLMLARGRTPRRQG